MFAKLESWFRRWRRRLSRREWAIRLLGLEPAGTTGEEPGLLLIQIDGLARTQFDRALASGRMPFLRRLLHREGYHLHTFYPGLPSTTPAVQAELYYGVRAAVPAFSFYDRVKGCHGLMCYPEWAKNYESISAAQNEGLLKGGASWSNIYTGGAEQKHSNFCAASIGLGDMWRSGKLRYLFLFLVLHLPSVLVTIALLIVEVFLAIWDLFVGLARGEKFLLELQMAVSRVFVGIGLREVMTTGAAVDVARGLPVVHVNFLGYDEQAHRRGPGSAFAHWSLRGIDRSIQHLYRAAHDSPRRDYTVWIFSDHGQERVQSFAKLAPGGIEEIVQRCLDRSKQRDPAWRPRSQRRPVAPWLWRRRLSGPRLEKLAASNALTPGEKASFTVAAMGPIGHVYFVEPLDDAQRRALAQRLVQQGQVPGVMVRSLEGDVTLFHGGGEARVPDDLPSLLPHAEALRPEIARDLKALGGNPNAGDLVLLGWAPGTLTWTFAPERGAHGGMGLEETRGFLLLPPRTRLPAGTEHFVRPAALRAAALHLLKRQALEVPQPVPVSGDIVSLRLMTYNTHGCEGVDGRVSPLRIARAIAAVSPDIVALQELDLGRRRSRAEDQAAIIARELDFHYVFCPTVTKNEEHYGHALLSRWPIEVVRRAFLPTAPGGWFLEPRSALWARVLLGARRINLITTHLGLGIQERYLQMEALMGPDWLGSVPPDEDVILCGDFNATPGSAPYRLVSLRLVDVQHAMAQHRPLRTFTSLQPFTRIDHVFVSRTLLPKRIVVPRNTVTRVASDHLPLVVDLATVTAAVETPLPKSA